MTLVDWLPSSQGTQSTSQAIYNKVSSDISFCDEKLVVFSQCFWLVGWLGDLTKYVFLCCIGFYLPFKDTLIPNIITTFSCFPLLLGFHNLPMSQT
jgi:hypothetical protein